jgi:hypothetical protein
MEYFRFTLFNAVTLLVMGLTVVVAQRRFAGRPTSNWPLAYWALTMAYAVGFHYSLNVLLIAIGAALALMIRLGFHAANARWAEMVVLIYVLWRCLALIFLW